MRWCACVLLALSASCASTVSSEGEDARPETGEGDASPEVSGADLSLSNAHLSSLSTQPMTAGGYTVRGMAIGVARACAGDLCVTGGFVP